jgi:RNA polymerase sigma factor (sigma-70 family)
LGQFVARNDEAAFGVLVRRHGPLVLGVCRRLLRHEQDAEDAFQATFLVLARKAAAIQRRAALLSWLYGVAYRIARRAAAAKRRRRTREAPLDDVRAKEETPAWARRELRTVLDEEISRLPVKFRDPVLLCYLRELTCEQAATELRIPTGTLMSRLSRARELLRGRLRRRGMAVTSSFVAAALTELAASTAIPAALVDVITKAAALFQAGGAPTAVSVKAVAWAQELLRARQIALMRIMAGLLVGLLLVTGSLWIGLPVLVPDAASAPRQSVAPPVTSSHSDLDQIQGIWVMTRMNWEGRDVNVDARWTMTFTKERCFFDFGPAGGFLESTITLDPTQTPKRIDFRYVTAPNSPGIYELDGDDLRICYDNASRERPNALATKPGSTFNLLILRREARP